MLEQNQYEQELRNICRKIKKGFGYRIGFISALATKKQVKKLIKLNKKTKDANINELIYVLGRTKYEYKKFCYENAFYKDPRISKIIKKSYIKLSRRAMKLETKKSYIKRKNEKTKIEYNSDRGTYMYKFIQGNKVVVSKEYTISDITHLGIKRISTMNRMKQYNFGISVFDELGVDSKKINKLNPDIISILLNEGKLTQAKMYVKQVCSDNFINTPLYIKYVLNKDVKKGKFSPEENKNMKKMAKADKVANEIVIFSEKKVKEIKKPRGNVLKKFVMNILNWPQKQPVPQAAQLKNVYANNSAFRKSLIVPDYNRVIPGSTYKNTNTGRIAAYGTIKNSLVQKQKGRFINTNTGKIAAYGAR